MWEPCCCLIGFQMRGWSFTGQSLWNNRDCEEVVSVLRDTTWEVTCQSVIYLLLNFCCSLFGSVCLYYTLFVENFLLQFPDVSILLCNAVNKHAEHFKYGLKGLIDIMIRQPWQPFFYFILLILLQPCGCWGPSKG